MKVKIDITEGCISYSYTINGIEWVCLTDPDNEDYNPGFLGSVLEELLSEVQEQYSLPSFVMDYLWDGECDLPCDDDQILPCTQDTFIRLVKNDKNTEVKNLGTCEECGDTVYEYKLTLEV